MTTIDCIPYLKRRPADAPLYFPAHASDVRLPYSLLTTIQTGLSSPHCRIPTFQSQSKTTSASVDFAHRILVHNLDSSCSHLPPLQTTFAVQLQTLLSPLSIGLLYPPNYPVLQSVHY